MIFNKNCFDVLDKIPDESIQLIYSDLPYNETGNKWDKSIVDLDQLFDQYLRILKPDGTIALNSTMRFANKLINTAPDFYKYEWVWEKDNGTNFVSSKYQPLRVHEFVLIFTKARVTYGKTLGVKYNPQMTVGKPYKQISGKSSENWKGKPLRNVETDNKGTRHPRTVKFFKRDTPKIHPTQKPLKLAELIVNSYTDKGDIVLDSFMGSGTTGVACKLNKRKFVGIELNVDYFKKAKERLNDIPKK